MKRFVIAGLFLFASAVTAQAQVYLSGNKYLPDCRAVISSVDGSRSNPSALTCLGYMDAARTYLVIAPEQLKSCTPGEVTNGQLARVVVKYLDDNPRRLHEPFFILVALALRQAFPCEK